LISLWDVAAMFPSEATPVREWSAKELDALWNDLAADDAERAYQAVRSLTAAPAQAVTLLSERVQTGELARWIADLESNRFAVRQRAADELKALGPLAHSALNKLLENNPSPETRKRVEDILKANDRSLLTAQIARQVRAVEVLEAVASPEARRVLKGLADGAAEARLTQEAKAACERLAK
jgi:hypothetical protein